jgi:hypothetical protein
MCKLIYKAAVSILLLTMSFPVNHKLWAASSAPSTPVRIASASIKYQIFDGTNSPNKRYAVAWGIAGRVSDSPRVEENDDLEKVENYLVDTTTNKVIAKLKYSKSFPNQNHGEIATAWTPNSQLLLIIHQAKWQPRDVSVVNVNGAQTSIYDQLVKDTRVYLAKNDGAAFQKNKERVVYSLYTSAKSFKLTNNRLQIPVSVYIPKENGYERNILLTYQVQTNSNPRLSLVNVKKINSTL